MSEDKKVREYRTSDIYFAAFLISIDIPLCSSERVTDGRSTRVVFILRISDADLAKAKSLYFGGAGNVRARKFVDNLKSLKAMCYV